MVTYEKAVAEWARLHSLLEAAAESAIPPLLDFVPEPEDETWRHTYAIKPEWWDDPSEPRCDVCGVHCEDTVLKARGVGWCGDCGCCGIHCEC